MANRNENRVRRAAYRNPSPKANSSAVNRTRDVRVSMRTMRWTPPVGPAANSSVPHHFGIVARHQDALQLELVVKPQGPFGALEADFFSAQEFHTQRLRRALLRAHGPELHLLVDRALDSALILLAGAGHEPPDQDFAVDKEVVVEHAGGSGEKEGLVLGGLLVGRARNVLHEELVAGGDGGLRFAGSHFLPFVLADVAVDGELQFGVLLRLVHTLLGLELRGDDAAVGVLLDREGFGRDPAAIHEDPERAGVHRLPGDFLFVTRAAGGRGQGGQGKQSCHATPCCSRECQCTTLLWAAGVRSWASRL